MADELEDDVDELVEGLEPKKTSGKKIVVIAGIVIVLLIAVGVFFLFGGEEHPAEDPEMMQETTQQTQKSNAPIFTDPPMEFMVNLNSNNRKATFLSINIRFQFESEGDKAAVHPDREPLVRDILNTFLRELREEDLQGTSGAFRLKEEMLRRVNNALAPIRVVDVLLDQYLVQ